MPVVRNEIVIILITNLGHRLGVTVNQSQLRSSMESGAKKSPVIIGNLSRLHHLVRRMKEIYPIPLKKFLYNCEIILEIMTNHLKGAREKEARIILLPSAISDNVCEKTAPYEVRRIVMLSDAPFFISLWMAVPEFDVNVATIGYGAFSSVFRILRNNLMLAVKLIPLSRDNQTSIKDCENEIICWKKLSSLRNGIRNRCEFFPTLHGLFFVRDQLGDKIVRAVERYHMENIDQTFYSIYNTTSNIAHPYSFPCDQIFLVVISEYCGRTLADSHVSTYVKAVHILKQLIAALAVAEEEVKFEHRDLHEANILLCNCQDITTEIKLKGTCYTLTTNQLLVKIVDYSLSRVTVGSAIKYVDLAPLSAVAADCGTDSHKTCYHKMLQLSNGNYKSYHPRSNLFFIRYISKVLQRKVEHYVEVPIGAEEIAAYLSLQTLEEHCEEYSSATDFFLRKVKDVCI